MTVKKASVMKVFPKPTGAQPWFRIEDDEDNPWRWINTAKIGDIVELVVRDRWGVTHLKGEYFLHDNRQWYSMDPPSLLQAIPVAWRVHRGEK